MNIGCIDPVRAHMHICVNNVLPTIVLINRLKGTVYSLHPHMPCFLVKRTTLSYIRSAQVNNE